MKEFIKKLPLAKYWLAPITNLRTQKLHKKRLQEAEQFDQFYGSTFEMVEEGSLVVRVPDFKGSFEIDFRSHILRRLLKNKKYEPELAAVVDKYLDPKQDVIDIGANIGLFTVLMAKKLKPPCKVLAVEPTPVAFSNLKKNIQRNGVADRAYLFEGIATEKKGRFPLNMIEGKEEYSSLGNLVHPSIEGQQQQVIQVEGETIDNLVRKNKLQPGFIKIDAEGAEMLVLRGAKVTLQQYHPIVITELSDLLLKTLGSSALEIVAFFNENGYEVMNIEHPDEPIISPFDGSVLALPRV
jgi:FkbM family methyltransferase